MQRVGFLGLGSMGAPMAWNVRKAGYPLVVYNRTALRARPFEEAGVPVPRSARALASQSDVIILMVSDDVALRQSLSAPDGVVGGLRPGALVVNMSTVSPGATTAAAQAVRQAGGRFVDAPVSGTVKPAQEGNLIILAAGSSSDVEAAAPLLRVLGREIIYCGEVGRGTRMKLALNLLLGGLTALLAETLVFSDRQGLDAAAVLKAIGAGPLNAPYFQIKGPLMAQHDFSRQFSVNLMFKDLGLVLAAAGAARVPLPMAAAARELFNAARGLGCGDEDLSAVVKVVERLADPAASEGGGS